MMDGAPNMQGTQVAYSPPPGVVDEFKVQGVTFDAGSGFMGGAAINMSLKSGANGVHGQVYYFMQNPVLNADKYFRLAVGKPQFRLYRWGGSVSGPVVIPKLYDGHNKTFFMYGYEGIWSFDPSPWVVETVPTAAQRTGNFSDLLALGVELPDLRSLLDCSGGEWALQPAAAAGQPDPGQPDQPGGGEDRPLVGCCQPGRNGRRDKQLPDGEKRSGHLLESHCPDRSQPEPEAALLCANEFHRPSAAGEYPPQQGRGRQLLSLQQGFRVR